MTAADCIPKHLIRTVPQSTSPQVEAWWADACAKHPGWQHITYRDPINPEWFPMTSPHWHRCTSGAQLAGLIRLEALWHAGGIYLDSDVQVYRNLGPLLQVEAFAAYEDATIVPDAVLGARPGHPAIGACLDLAIERLVANKGDWTTKGAWGTGPGVTTTVLKGRDDVLILGPDSFYPVHYSISRKDPGALTNHQPKPWTWGIHHWNHSWA